MSCHHRPGTTLLPEFRLEMFRCSRERSVSREVLTNLLSAGSDERSTFTSKVIESLFLSGNNSGNDCWGVESGHLMRLSRTQARPPTWANRSRSVHGKSKGALLTRREARTNDLVPRQATFVLEGRRLAKFRASASGTYPKRVAEFVRLDGSDTTPAHPDRLYLSCNRGRPAHGC